MNGLQVGFGEFIGADTLQSVKEQGFSIVRISGNRPDSASQSHAHNALEPEHVRDLAQEVVDAGLQPLVIVSEARQMTLLHPGALVECGNEPDIAHFGWTKSSYARHAQDCVNVARASGQRLYVGAVSNLNSRGFDWLDELPWNEWTEGNICCSVHRYPNGTTPQVPHKGFKSREDEVRKLRSIIGNRPLAITETGYTLAKWSETQQAEFLAWENSFWKKHGAELVVAYQINTGQGNSELDLYGLRRLDGSWRPAAQMFTGAI